MSLGLPGLSATLQAAVSAARSQGVIMVAAAGNKNENTPHSPASLDGVISVSAVDINALKASYSNFGSGIDVAAPGGNLSFDLNGDGFGDGVLSTLGDDQGGFFARFFAGTSMASPHVAGVMALMLAVNPNLTPTDIDQLLAGTHPDTTLGITRDLGAAGRDDFFGHGLIDAAAAVIAANSVPGGTETTPTGSILTVSTNSLDFDNFLSLFPVSITNAGIGTLTITTITDNASWLTLTPTSGTAPLIVNATVDRTGLATGAHTATISITSDASQGSQTATISVDIQVGGNAVGNVGPVSVLVINSDTFEIVAQVETDVARNYDFTTPSIASGTYIIVAGTDRDDDGILCEIEDACGFFPDLVTIAAGQDTSDINFVVGELVSPQSTAPALSGLREVPLVRLH
jgi:serine protease